MTIKRLKDFNKLEAALIKKLYEQVRNKYRDGAWREFNGRFRIGDRLYRFQCIFRLDDFFMSFRDKQITDGQDRIILPYNGKLS